MVFIRDQCGENHPNKHHSATSGTVRNGLKTQVKAPLLLASGTKTHTDAILHYHSNISSGVLQYFSAIICVKILRIL